jgi:hypothetical protein
MDHLKQAFASLQPPKPQRVIFYLKALRDEKLGKHRQFLATQDCTEGLSQEYGSDFLTEVQMLEAAISAVEADTDLQECFTKPVDVPLVFTPCHFAYTYNDLPFGTPCGADAGNTEVILTSSWEAVTCGRCHKNRDAIHLDIGHRDDFSTMACGLEIPDKDKTCDWVSDYPENHSDVTCTGCTYYLQSLRPDRRQGPSKGWEYRKGLVDGSRKKELEELLHTELTSGRPVDPRASNSTGCNDPTHWKWNSK